VDQEKSGNPDVATLRRHLGESWSFCLQTGSLNRHLPGRVLFRVARWFIFKPKIQIWVYLGGPWNVTCNYILWPFGIFTAIWYNLWPLFCGHLVYFPSFGMFGPKKSGNPGSV
jgi:hypothetical protein